MRIHACVQLTVQCSFCLLDCYVKRTQPRYLSHPCFYLFFFLACSDRCLFATGTTCMNHRKKKMQIHTVEYMGVCHIPCISSQTFLYNLMTAFWKEKKWQKTMLPSGCGVQFLEQPSRRQQHTGQLIVSCTYSHSLHCCALWHNAHRISSWRLCIQVKRKIGGCTKTPNWPCPCNSRLFFSKSNKPWSLTALIIEKMHAVF